MVFGVGAFFLICVGVLYWRNQQEINAQANEMQRRVEDEIDHARQLGRATFGARFSDLARYVQTAQRLCANKGAILLYTFQVIYQYANIVTGYEFNLDYPEPAKSVVEYLSMFGLSILSISPPECVFPDSNFYTRVLFASQGPLCLILVGFMLVLVYNRCRGNRAQVEWHHAFAYVLAFLEFVLSGVATAVCKTFVCEEIEGVGKVLVEQPTLLCEDLDGEASSTRRAFEIYSGLMIILYPVGVPLLMFVSLWLQQREIKRLMRVKKAIVVDELSDFPHDFFSDDSEEQQEIVSFISLLREESKANREAEEPSVEEIAIALRDSDRHHHDTMAAPRQVSPLLLSMVHTYEKFEPDTYWFGEYLLTVRLLETSMLVFFKKPSTKAMIATAVSFISLAIAQKCQPWLRDSDDQVRSSARARCMRLSHTLP